MAWKDTPYHCIFSCQGDVEMPLKERVCFSDALNLIWGKASVYYRIYIPQVATNSSFNLCSPQEVKYALNKLRTIVPFTFKYDPTMHSFKGKPFGVLSLHIEGPIVVHKLILTFTRCFFEFPYNVIVKETIKVYPEVIKELHVGNYVSWFNVFLTIESCSPHRGVHAFTSRIRHDPGILTIKDIRSKIKGTQYLNDLFEGEKEYLEHPGFEFPNTLCRLESRNKKKARIKHYVELLEIKLGWMK